MPNLAHNKEQPAKMQVPPRDPHQDSIPRDPEPASGRALVGEGAAQGDSRPHATDDDKAARKAAKKALKLSLGRKPSKDEVRAHLAAAAASSPPSRRLK